MFDGLTYAALYGFILAFAVGPIFFTLIEMALPEWAAGAKSPVISINKILKSRGHKLEKDMLLWIKQNSDNRFIPNGSPLL